MMRNVPDEEAQSVKPSSRVLICEDEGIVAADIRMTLRDLGYLVIGTVASAEKAVELALSMQPDLVLMDIHTKGQIDGVEAAKAIRDEARIPVVFLTAHADAETVLRARSAEPLGYVVKPFKDIDLHTAIEIALQRHATEEKLREREHSLALETERLTTLIANLTTGVLLEDEHGQVRHANAQLSHLFDDAAAIPTGTASASIIARISSRCREATATRAALQKLSDERIRGEALLHCAASGRAIELGYVPIGGERYAGALWTFSDVTEREQAREVLRKQAEQMHELATTDELTGLLNRRGLLTLAAMQKQIALRERRAILTAYIDLDGMKQVNDTLGHRAGDELLRMAADVLRKTFRASDVLARVGGDEFAVLALVSAASDVGTLSDRLLRNVDHENRTRPKERPALAMSIGLVISEPTAHEEIDVLIARADRAMYEQKRARKASLPSLT